MGRLVNDVADRKKINLQLIFLWKMQRIVGKLWAMVGDVLGWNSRIKEVCYSSFDFDL